MSSAVELKYKQRIVPFLSFVHNAEEAVDFYVSCFNNSKIFLKNYYNSESAKASGFEEGSLLTCSFTLNNQEFIALNGGTDFQFSAANSLFVNCESVEQADALWNNLMEGGKTLMEYKEYPFSKKYGWLQDRFGLSWQVHVTDGPQLIAPCLMFTGKEKGRAEEAIHFYQSIFQNCEIKILSRYDKNEGVEGYINHARFTLEGEDFVAMDSHLDNKVEFTMAFSFMVLCDNQQEIDLYWDKLTSGGKEIVCGWLEDKFGISWQVAPVKLLRLISDSDPEVARKSMHSMMQMKKIIIADLEQ